MAKRKSKGRSNGRSLALSSQMSRDILGVILTALAFLILLAELQVAGDLGNIIFNFLKLLFGYIAFSLPIIFGYLGYKVFTSGRNKEDDEDENGISVNVVAGLITFLISTTGLLQLVAAPETSLEMSQAGKAGGMLGFVIREIMTKSLLNIPATAVILVAVFFISLILISNTGLRELWEMILGLFKKGPREDITINEPVTSMAKLPIKGTFPGKGGQPNVSAEALTVLEDPDWKLPSLDLLDATTSKPNAGNIKENAAIIQKTLGNFGVDVAMADVNVGPTVTQYTLKPSTGVKLNKITTLEQDLALAVAAHPIRVEAPIPGKSLVGIEIPNKSAALVRLKEIISDDKFKATRSNLTFALGRDTAGAPIIADLARMPHLLIAGATGSGKSVGINTILLSFLYRNSPSQLKLILVDPKRVELTPYNGIPHLLAPVIVDPEKTISALKWTVAEMERRYRLFAEEGKRNIIEYNNAKKEQAMPYIVVVLDELADLMVVAAKDVEALIVRLAQMARATGIHLILATQRPSVDVITGLIKANVPARVAYAVASQVDSRTIIDQSGADKLLGNGDLLFVTAETPKPRRVQGAFVDEKEINKVTSFLKEAGEPEYNEEVTKMPVKVGGGIHGDMGEPDDEMFNEAAEVVIAAGKASASLLQRRLRVGYARAARLLDLLEEQGIVGPPDGARPREVLVSSMEDAGEPEDAEF